MWNFPFFLLSLSSFLFFYSSISFSDEQTADYFVFGRYFPLSPVKFLFFFFYVIRILSILRNRSLGFTATLLRQTYVIVYPLIVFFLFSTICCATFISIHFVLQNHLICLFLPEKKKNKKKENENESKIILLFFFVFFFMILYVGLMGQLLFCRMKLSKRILFGIMRSFCFAFFFFFVTHFRSDRNGAFS